MPLGPMGTGVMPEAFDVGTLARYLNRPPKPRTDVPMCPARLPWPMVARGVVLDMASTFLQKEEAVPLHPYWPGGVYSGVTWGVGWDAGLHTEKEIRDTWADLEDDDIDALAECAGLHGDKAKEKLDDVADIEIPKKVSLAVLKAQTLPVTYQSTLKAFPGLQYLPLGTQVALLSLVYNRGADLGKEQKDKKGKVILDRRYEMRQIRSAVTALDLKQIAQLLRAMERVWVGTDIQKMMRVRREHEANLIDVDVVLLTSPFNTHWQPPTTLY